MEGKVQILDQKKISNILIRIAHEIAEFNYDEPEVILVGIADRGFQLAEIIFRELQNIYPEKIQLGSLKMDKQNPVSDSYELDMNMDELAGKSVILVDDVLESGRTLIYASKFILNAPVKKLTTVILVDRMHPKFPLPQISWA